MRSEDTGRFPVRMKLYQPFIDEIERLKDKYGDRFLELNGFSEDQLNATNFIDNFIDIDNVADATIDQSANTHAKDICTLENEMPKSQFKLLAFHKFYYEMDKAFGRDRANEWLEAEWNGHFYMHDAHSASYLPYCYAYDIDQLVTKGLFFIPKFNASAPKHLTTYTDFVGEFVSWTSNRTSGACGLPSFLVYSFYFWKKDVENGYYIKSPEYYRDQEFQRIIYKLNQPFLRISQSSFTNFSIFDHSYFESIFGGKEFPDGTFMIDYEDEIIEYQKAFMEVCSKIRSENMMTFPVITTSLLRKDGKFVDEDFARWACSHNMKWGDSNFFVSEDVTTLSNCCFDGKQMVLAKSSTAGVIYKTFKELYEMSSDDKKNFTIFHNGSWVKGKVVRQPARKMYKITTMNNKTIYVTDNHINPTLRGDISTTELTTDDYLLFNTSKLHSYKEKDKHLTYAEGFLLGMYLGDGSSQKMKNMDAVVVNLSLNKSKYEESIDILNQALEDLDETEYKFHLSKPYNNVYPLAIHSKKVYHFIKKYIHGNRAFNKELDMSVLLQAKKFRRGILDGYYLTDGGNSNRIYTTSEKLVYQMEALLTSLGKISIINESDRRDEGLDIRGQHFNRNFILYCIRWYEGGNRRTEKNVFIRKNNNTYFKIKSIESYKYTDKFVYCFEMKNQDEPYFTLPNGIITHNCRLLSDIKNLGYFNSIGGTALEVGSIKVNTINLARLAYESNDKDDYIKNLVYYTKLACDILDRVRYVIKRNAEKGLLPNYTLGVINMKSQYNTIGIIGVYETLQHYGLTRVDEFGNTTYTDEGIEFAKEILKTITDVKNAYMENKDYSINIEEIPGERAAAILKEKDQELFPNEKYELPLYGNQWVPLGIKTSLYNKLRLSAILDKACSGGSICHINVDNPLTDFDTAWKLMNYIADQGVTYFAYNYKISACEHNHGFYGETCPYCGEKKTDTYTRIVGYFVPTSSYSSVRKDEFKKRTWMDLNGMSEL